MIPNWNILGEGDPCGHGLHEEWAGHVGGATSQSSQRPVRPCTREGAVMAPKRQGGPDVQSCVLSPLSTGAVGSRAETAEAQRHCFGNTSSLTFLLTPSPLEPLRQVLLLLCWQKTEFRFGKGSLSSLLHLTHPCWASKTLLLQYLPQLAPQNEGTAPSAVFPLYL